MNMKNPLHLSHEDLEIQKKRNLIGISFGEIQCEEIVIEREDDADEPADKN